MDVTQFRKDFPEFADTAKYPNHQVTFWSALGEKTISSDRFGSVFTTAVQLYTAHNLTLAARAAIAAAAGGIPGAPSSGLASSKSVGAVSVSYDTSAASVAAKAGDGEFATTTYGQRYRQLVRLFGAGAVHV